jgi:ribosome maturation factor RimP
VGTVEKLRELAEPVVRARRCEIYDLDLARRGQSRLLRVMIDRPGGVDTETCAEVSRLLSRALDEADPIDGGYTLEVSSPGLERSLRQPEHFAAVAGTELTVRAKVRGTTGSELVEGNVIKADLSGFELHTPDARQVSLSYDDVISARTVFRWGPAGRPAKGGRHR